MAWFVCFAQLPVVVLGERTATHLRPGTEPQPALDVNREAERKTLLAVGASDMLGITTGNQNQNAVAYPGEAHACTRQSVEPDKCHLPGIEGHMHRLLACEKEVEFWPETTTAFWSIEIY